MFLKIVLVLRLYMIKVFYLNIEKFCHKNKHKSIQNAPDLDTKPKENLEIEYSDDSQDISTSIFDGYINPYPGIGPNLIFLRKGLEELYTVGKKRLKTSSRSSSKRNQFSNIKTTKLNRFINPRRQWCSLMDKPKVLNDSPIASKFQVNQDWLPDDIPQ